MTQAPCPIIIGRLVERAAVIDFLLRVKNTPSFASARSKEVGMNLLVLVVVNMSDREMHE